MARWDFLQATQTEAICYGLCTVNIIYLTAFISLNFIVFRLAGSTAAYLLSTLVGSIGTLTISDYMYGHIE
jgi:hypothetical protein